MTGEIFVVLNANRIVSNPYYLHPSFGVNEYLAISIFYMNISIFSKQQVYLRITQLSHYFRFFFVTFNAYIYIFLFDILRYGQRFQ